MRLTDKMKITICKNGRTFEAYVGSLGGGLAEVSFYEVVRPSWKIFRTKFFPFHSSGFFVQDYPNIIVAVSACLDKGFEEEAEEKEISEKWKNFSKPY